VIRWNFAEMFAVRKVESWDDRIYFCVMMCLTVFIEHTSFDDGRTDKQTDGWTDGHIVLAYFALA